MKENLYEEEGNWNFFPYITAYLYIKAPGPNSIGEIVHTVGILGPMSTVFDNVN